MERLLRDTHVPTDLSDNRRLDLVAPGLAVAGGGSPLFCDVTCVSPLTVGGAARSGTTLRDGGSLAAAHRENNRTYPEVGRSGLGRLCCLAVETFGLWGDDPLWLVPAMARERSRGLPERVRQGSQAALCRRWWGLLSIATQRSVARGVLRSAGGDLADAPLEPAPFMADLPVAS